MRTVLNAAVFIFLAFFLALGSPASAQYNAFEDPGKASADGATAGPDLKPVSNKIDGGDVAVGSTAYVIVLFENKGTAPVKTGGVKLYPSSTVTADISLNQCLKDPLPPAATCAITVAISGLKAGAWRVEMLVEHNGRSRLVSAILAGKVDAGQDSKSSETASSQIETDVVAKPAAIEFGSFKGGLPLIRYVTLRNVATERVALKDIRIDAAPQSGFSLKTECPEALDPGQACLAALSWAPVTKGRVTGSLIAQHAGRGGMTQVDISGEFSPDASKNAEIYPEIVPDKGLLVSDMDKIDFGSAVRGISSMTVSLVNSGAADLMLTGIRLSGSDSGLSISRSGCRTGTVLSPVEACPLTINWLPSREGEVIDDLQITHSGARGILVLPIRGSADKAVSRESMALRVASVDSLPPPLPSGGGTQALPPAEEISAALEKKDGDEPEKSAPPPLPANVSESAMAPSLDGYVVTSHSHDRAVLAGPVGSQIVRHGKKVVISGVSWDVRIVEEGVELTSAHDKMLMVFDRSLTPNRFGKQSDDSSSDSSDDDDSDSSSSSSSSSDSSSSTSSEN